MYDGFSTNMLTGGKNANPDSICINQPGDNVFVNSDFINMAQPEKWHPDTNMTAFICK
jgi:hypothetical protein